MKVAYVFASPRAASHKLGQMILPQLEAGTHVADVVGMFFFDDNTFLLRDGDPAGERLARVASDQGILLMMCDMCALERGLAEGEPRWCDWLAVVGPSRAESRRWARSKGSTSDVSRTCTRLCRKTRRTRSSRSSRDSAPLPLT
jgi:hypothetical protein